MAVFRCLCQITFYSVGLFKHLLLADLSVCKTITAKPFKSVVLCRYFLYDYSVAGFFNGLQTRFRIFVQYFADFSQLK